MRTRILRVPNDLGGRCRRSIQDDTIGSILNSSRVSGVIRCFFVVDEGICNLYRTIHCSIETTLGGLSGPLLLHIFGMVDFFVLDIRGKALASFV